MYALVVLAALLAPAPIVKPAPDFKPGTYDGRWGGADWGTFHFDSNGVYFSEYSITYMTNVVRYRYEGNWWWCPKRRVLTIVECQGSFDVNKYFNTFELQFGKALNKSIVKSNGIEVPLEPRR